MEAAANKRSYIRLGAIRLLLKATDSTDVCMIPARADAGLNAEAAQGRLILAITSAPMSSESFTRKTGSVLR